MKKVRILSLPRSAVYSCMALLLLAACKKLPLTNSNYTAEKPDTGNSQRIWNDSLKYNSESRLMYGIKNDKDNLYITMRCLDDNTNNKIMTLGLNMWIDTTGHRKEKLGIKYPLGIKEAGSDWRPAKENARTYPSAGRVDVSSRNEALKKWIEMDLVGFDKEPIRAFITTPIGIKVKAEFDSVGAFCYYAIVPFKAIHYRMPAENAKKPVYLTIGFTTNKPENKPSESDNNMGGTRGDPRTNGMGTMQGTAMRSSVGGMHANRNPNLQESLDFWTHVNVAREK